jgi:hypothetical protein
MASRSSSWSGPRHTAQTWSSGSTPGRQCRWSHRQWSKSSCPGLFAPRARGTHGSAVGAGAAVPGRDRRGCSSSCRDLPGAQPAQPGCGSPGNRAVGRRRRRRAAGGIRDLRRPAVSRGGNAWPPDGIAKVVTERAQPEPHPHDRVEFAPVVDARRFDMITAASSQGQVKFVSGAGPHLALGGFGDVFE